MTGEAMSEQQEREFAVTFTYIITAISAQEAMKKLGENSPEPDRITVMPNMGI